MQQPQARLAGILAGLMRGTTCVKIRSITPLGWMLLVTMMRVVVAAQ